MLCEKDAIVQECIVNCEGIEEMPSIVQAFVWQLASMGGYTKLKV